MNLKAGMIEPVGERVFVRLLKDEEVNKGGIVLPEETERAEDYLFAEVIALPRLKKIDIAVGDKILIARSEGRRFKLPDGEYRLLESSAILARLR